MSKIIPFDGHLKVTLLTLTVPRTNGLSMRMVVAGSTFNVAKRTDPLGGVQSTKNWTSFATCIRASLVTKVVLAKLPSLPLNGEHRGKSGGHTIHYIVSNSSRFELH